MYHWNNMGKPHIKPSESPAVKVASGIRRKYLSPGKPSLARRALLAIKPNYFQISPILWDRDGLWYRYPSVTLFQIFWFTCQHITFDLFILFQSSSYLHEVISLNSNLLQFITFGLPHVFHNSHHINKKKSKDWRSWKSHWWRDLDILGLIDGHHPFAWQSCFYVIETALENRAERKKNSFFLLKVFFQFD